MPVRIVFSPTRREIPYLQMAFAINQHAKAYTCTHRKISKLYTVLTIDKCTFKREK